ncbi:MAG: hypothetical protein V1831_03600 [Candidatus Woesearchaeota archaeon]
MKKLGKKAIVGIIKLVGVIVAVILLIFLIKNSWNVSQAINDMLSLFRLK